MRIIVAIAGLVLGCGHRDNDNAERIVAAERCADAFSKIANVTELADVTAIYARGCSGLYRQPRCHDAIANLANTNPADRLVAITRPCALAYCGVLTDPLPELCVPGASRLAGNELAVAWKQLDARILAVELDLAPDSPMVERIAGAVTLEITAKVPRRPPPAARPQQQTVSVALSGDRIAIEIDQRSWRLPNPPSPGDLAPVMAALDPHEGVLLASSQDVPYAVIIAVMDAIQRAGITEIGLSATAP